MSKQDQPKAFAPVDKSLFWSTNQEQEEETSSIIVLIAQELSNFPNIMSFVKTNNVRPSSVFLPQTIKTISDTISYNDSIIFEAIDLLDTVRLFSVLLYSNEDFFIDSIKSIISSSRTVKDTSLTIGINQLDDFIYTSKEHLLDVLDSNHTLLAIYIFSLVFFVSFSE